MKPEHIFQAIENLAPGAEVTFTETDLDTLVWYKDEITQPTNEQIMAKALELEQTEPQRKIDQAKAKATVKAALLERLGITEDELQTLFG